MDKVNRTVAAILDCLIQGVVQDGLSHSATTSITVKYIGKYRFVIAQRGDEVEHVRMAFYCVPNKMRVDDMTFTPGDWIPLWRDNGVMTVGVDIDRGGHHPKLVNGDIHEKHINFAHAWLPGVLQETKL